jgi:hypothetical protein
MSSRSLTPSALVAVTLLALGCGPKPPPPEPPAPPAPVVEKAPPKCESFSEKCAAESDTRAKINNSDLIFTPAKGWIYAQLSSATVAQQSEIGPAVAFTGFDADAKDAKKDAAHRDATLSELAKQLSLGALKKKINWKKPAETKAVGDLKVGLWQLDEAGVRGAKKGPLLVVVASVSDQKGVMGVGFVPDDDSSKADEAILKIIESIGKSK